MYFAFAKMLPTLKFFSTSDADVGVALPGASDIAEKEIVAN